MHGLPRFLGLSLLLTAAFGHTGEVRQIDPYPLDPFPAQRCVADIASGGQRPLGRGDLIDWVLVGDGYLASERDTFFDHATALYQKLFGSCTLGCSSEPPCGGGLFPYPYFPQAFRVRAVFNPSPERASSRRGSHYAVKLDADSKKVVNDGWWEDGGSANTTFRQRLQGSLDDLAASGPPHNPRFYPADLDVDVSGKPIIHHRLAGSFSHLVVSVLILSDNAVDPTPSGLTRRVDKDFAHGIAVAFADLREHEFGHAFPYLEDEYISERDSGADRNDPPPAERSIYKLSNLTYGNRRCSAPWSHIGPGGAYNRDSRSLVGNLYRGGEQDRGVWHSEYKCLMNGGHENYACELSGPDTNLRDRGRLCFWCEEIVALRILEKTGQLACPGSDPNLCGRESWVLWTDGLRARYYARFDLAGRIAARGACLDGDPAHAAACDRSALPACLRECAIRDHGGAVHVDAATGSSSASGSRLDPFADPQEAAAASCGPTRLVAIRPGSYPGPYRLDKPATFATHGCGTTSLGRQ